MAADLGLKTGIVVTGGSFENSLIDDREIRNLDGSVVEMESAAVGKMSMLLGKQFMAAKAIVDFDDAVGFAGQFDITRSSASAKPSKRTWFEPGKTSNNCRQSLKLRF